jgi:radical SAM superfamily enzyme YgiQ (UPF0313 family)
MRILLIIPKHNHPLREPSLTVFPMGLPYIAGALKAAGHEVRGININFRYCAGSPQEEFRQEIRRAVAEFRPGLIGTGGLSAEFASVRELIALCREEAPEIPVVLGGGVMTCDIDYIMTTLRPDFGVHGEGEETIVELAAALAAGGAVSEVAGLIHWAEGKPRFTGRRKLPKHIEHLPLPSYREFGIEDFFAISDHSEWNGARWAYYTGGAPRVLPISAARGCPFPCTFCTHPAAQSYRIRTVPDVIQEIVTFHEDLHCNAFSLLDELFSVKPERVFSFCDQLKATGIKIKWNCQLRIDALSREMLAAMKDAGCQWVSYGLESASQTVLDSMKKKTRVEQIVRAIEMTTGVGLGIVGNFIYGDPAETPDTMRETARFFNQYCRGLNVHLSSISVYPDTALFKYCEDHRVFPDRDTYYRNIRDQGLNMTGMPTGLYRKLLGPLVNDLYNYPMAREVRFTPIEPEPRLARLTAAEPAYRRYRVTGRCPACDGALSYEIGRTDTLTTPAGRHAALKPHQIHCAHCHKRMMMDMSDLVGGTDKLRRFVERVNALTRGDWPPVVLFSPENEQKLDIWRAYGLKLDDLNLLGFCDPTLWDAGMRVLGRTQLLPFTQEVLKLRRNLHLVLLPTANDPALASVIVNNGGAARNLVMMDPL